MLRSWISPFFTTLYFCNILLFQTGGASPSPTDVCVNTRHGIRFARIRRKQGVEDVAPYGRIIVFFTAGGKSVSPADVCVNTPHGIRFAVSRRKRTVEDAGPYNHESEHRWLATTARTSLDLLSFAPFVSHERKGEKNSSPLLTYPLLISFALNPFPTPAALASSVSMCISRRKSLCTRICTS